MNELKNAIKNLIEDHIDTRYIPYSEDDQKEIDPESIEKATNAIIQHIEKNKTLSWLLNTLEMPEHRNAGNIAIIVVSSDEPTLLKNRLSIVSQYENKPIQGHTSAFRTQTSVLTPKWNNKDY